MVSRVALVSCSAASSGPARSYSARDVEQLRREHRAPAVESQRDAPALTRRPAAVRERELPDCQPSSSPRQHVPAARSAAGRPGRGRRSRYRGPIRGSGRRRAAAAAVSLSVDDLEARSPSPQRSSSHADQRLGEVAAEQRSSARDLGQEPARWATASASGRVIRAVAQQVGLDQRRRPAPRVIRRSTSQRTGRAPGGQAGHEDAKPASSRPTDAQVEAQRRPDQERQRRERDGRVWSGRRRPAVTATRAISWTV